MTLSEVLVSMLIMSVGVVSLSTLFPISVLRTAQATQLTHSVFLRNNAEAAVESNLGLLSNSQLPAPTTMDVGNPNWITYGVIDPLGGFLVSPAQPNFGGIATRPRLSGGVTTLAQAEQLASLPDSWSLVREEAVTATSFAASPPTITVGNSLFGLYVRNNYVATSATTSNTSQARHRIVMFDATGKLAVLQPLYQVQQVPPYTLSWWDVNSTTGASLTTGPSLPTGFIPTRVRIEVQDRRYTWLMTVRKHWVPSGPLKGADGQYGVAGTDDDGVNGTDDLGELRYPGSDDDPNWAAELDVAVFYNRLFEPPGIPPIPGDETAYTITFNVGGYGFDGAPGVSGVDDDNNTTRDWTNSPTNTIPDPGEVGFPGSDDNRTVTVTYAAPPTKKPYFKKGSYMLEPNQLKWYRILDLKESSTTTTVLLLDQDLRYPATSAATVTVQGIFLKGIVEVYSLGSRTGQQ